MKKQNKWLLIVGLLSLLAAAGGGLYAYRFYDSLVTTATAVTVARAVQNRLEVVGEELPETVQVVTGADQSRFIRASIREVLFNALIGSQRAIVTAGLKQGRTQFQCVGVIFNNFGY